jgi:hypothetical protein
MQLAKNYKHTMFTLLRRPCAILYFLCFLRLQTGLNVELYKEKSRILYVNLDFSFFLDRRTIIEKTQPKALFYTIRLNNLTAIWQVYHLHLIPSVIMEQDEYNGKECEFLCNNDAKV